MGTDPYASTDIDGFSYYALDQLRDIVRSGCRDEPIYVDLTPVAAAIDALRSVTEARLNALVDAVANPTATAGDELFRRGLLAWRNAWLDDAERDLRKSVDAYPYRAGPHLFLGLTLLERKEPGEAVQTLKAAVKYGPGGDAASAAAAALVADTTLFAAGAKEAAVDVLTNASSSLPECPQISERLFLRTRDGSQLDAAVRGIISKGLFPVPGGTAAETDGEAARVLERARPHLEVLREYVDRLREATTDNVFVGHLVREYDEAAINADHPVAQCIAASRQVEVVRGAASQVDQVLSANRERCATLHNLALDWVNTPPRRKIRGYAGGFFERRRRYDEERREKLQEMARLKRNAAALDAARELPVFHDVAALHTLLPSPRPNQILAPVIVPHLNVGAPRLAASVATDEVKSRS